MLYSGTRILFTLFFCKDVRLKIFLRLYEYTERTSFYKGVFLGPEYFNNILGTNSHIKGTCIAANFESNGPLVWCLLSIKCGWGNFIPVLPEVMN